MTVSSGFFNSVNHDRVYDAEQFSSIFDGVINDGVYESVGDAFSITPNTSVNDSVIVGTGRAWFDHTWTYNDAQFSLTLEPPNLVATRIDAIVIDVDRRDSARNNSIIVVQGTPAQDAQKPSMILEELHRQYPIAYITIPPGNSDIISSSNIEYNVGKSNCPLVTGPLEVINSDNFFAQMDANFEIFKDGISDEWNTWFDGIKDLIDDLNIGNINLVNSVDNVTIEWPSETKKLRVKDRGITREKLSFDLQSIIGVLDPSSWSYQDYYDYISTIDDPTEEETFITQYVTSDVVSLWTSDQIIDFCDVLVSDNSKNTIWNGIDWINQSLSGFRSLVEYFGSSKHSSMIGKKVKIDMGDTYGVHNFIVIGVNHDTLSSGGTALLTFQSEDIVTEYQGLFEVPSGKYFNLTPIATLLNSIIEQLSSNDQSVIKEVNKEVLYTNGEYQTSFAKTTYSAKIWIASSVEIGLRSLASGYEYQGEGTLYDYWSSRRSNPANYKKTYLGSNMGWMTRTDKLTWTYGGLSNYTARLDYEGVNDNGNESVSTGIGGYGIDVSFNFGTGYQTNPVGSTHESSNETVIYYHTGYLVPCFCV